MEYRVLGRTGLRVSELGLGGHEYSRMPNPYHFPEEKNMEEFSKTQPQRSRLIERAIDAGINYFDTTLVEEAESLGLALKALGRRRDVHIAATMVYPFRRIKEVPKLRRRETISKVVEKRLELLQTDYIDVFNIDKPEADYSRDRIEVTLEALEEMKDQSRIGSIGASSHELAFLAELIRKYDCFDSVMVRYNYHLQEAREVIFPLCEALGVGIVVMKPFAWPYYGIPFMRFAPVEREECIYTPAQVSLRWILSSPEVATVVPSMNRLDELEENLAAITKEGKIDEEILRQCLHGAQDPQAEEKLRGMLDDPAVDIRLYAKKALTTDRTP